MLKKTVETTQNDGLRAEITITYLLFNQIVYQKHVEKALFHLFPDANF